MVNVIVGSVNVILGHGNVIVGSVNVILGHGECDCGFC